MHSVNAIKILLALLPFATLVAGFLVFRLSALMTAILTCAVEFLVVIAYYHLSLVKSIEAALWGNLTMWSVFILLWSGQIFGQTFRATGLIPVLLDSFGSLSPLSDRRGRALTLVTLLSAFVGTFNLYAVYPVAIPALAELGFDGVQAAAGYLIYASWCIPFAALFIGAVIASTATGLPVAEIARASGLLTIPSSSSPSTGLTESSASASSSAAARPSSGSCPSATSPESSSSPSFGPATTNSRSWPAVSSRFRSSRSTAVPRSAISS
ncbi:hypothetical protein [Tunturiibacter gelidiferens]|uniref:hypothetical protein n=1 Tax=Tunturiibacter gelidiferens TaxID=3069689 RepID=UPI003D9B0ED4